jgi:hypothetical protein
LDPGLAWGMSVLYTNGALGLVGEGPGDFNFDNVVDGADLLAWQRGQSTHPLGASDLADWKRTAGPPPSPSSLFRSRAAQL